MYSQLFGLFALDSMNILRLHLHIESIHANGSDDQRGVEALSARSSSSFLEVTWRLQEGATPLAFYSHLIQWFYPVFSSMVSCFFTAFSGPMAAALPVREHTRLISSARHRHSLAALNIAIMFSGATSTKI